MVIIFNVKDPKQPVMVHAVRIIKQARMNKQPIDFVKQLDLDPDRNTLICRTKMGQISVMQLMNPLIRSQIIEEIRAYEGQREERQTQFKWLSRMSCYVEGTERGFMRVRDIEKGGECMLQLQTQFAEKVRMVHYNKKKNVLFAASRDGQFRVWKIPHEWRSKIIEEREMDAEYDRRRRSTVKNSMANS